jgi:hypothetical protein
MPERGRRDPAGGWRHPGWSWTVRHGRLIPAGYGLAALFGGGALGVVPALVIGDWKAGQTWAQLWLCVGLGVVAAAALGLSETARRGRDRMLARNGTAYIIQEQARFWADDKAERFRAGIRRQFARVVQVPGPAELSRGWDWPLDADARHWDGKADELVRAFRVLSVDEARDGTVTPNGVFMWAWWAVAMAFGMRATAADRSLVLDVWQRPSNARMGEVTPETWAQRPHRFGPAALPGGLAVSKHVWPAELTLSRRGRTRPSRGNGDVGVLLVRFSSQEWGPLPEVTARPPEDRLALHLYDAAGVVPAAASRTEIHELRCVPPGERFPWRDFPGLAAAAAAWIERKATELAGRTLLLGTLMPQEVGLGLGILAGQESRRASWPVHLWPVVFEPSRREHVIPNLNLGSAAIAPGFVAPGGA